MVRLLFILALSIPGFAEQNAVVPASKQEAAHFVVQELFDPDQDPRVLAMLLELVSDPVVRGEFVRELVATAKPDQIQFLVDRFDDLKSEVSSNGYMDFLSFKQTLAAGLISFEVHMLFQDLYHNAPDPAAQELWHVANLAVNKMIVPFVSIWALQDLKKLKVGARKALQAWKSERERRDLIHRVEDTIKEGHPAVRSASPDPEIELLQRLDDLQPDKPVLNHKGEKRLHWRMKTVKQYIQDLMKNYSAQSKQAKLLKNYLQQASPSEIASMQALLKDTPWENLVSVKVAPELGQLEKKWIERFSTMPLGELIKDTYRLEQEHDKGELSRLQMPKSLKWALGALGAYVLVEANQLGLGPSPSDIDWRVAGENLDQTYRSMIPTLSKVLEWALYGTGAYYLLDRTKAYIAGLRKTRTKLSHSDWEVVRQMLLVAHSNAVKDPAYLSRTAREAALHSAAKEISEIKSTIRVKSKHQVFGFCKKAVKALVTIVPK